MKFFLLVCFFCVFPQVVQATVCEKVFASLKFFAPKSKSIIEVTEPATSHSIQKSRTNLEQELKDQGWTADYYRGLNDLTEWVAVKKKLQALKADPYKTHIEYFAKKVEEHIAFATKEMSRFASDEQKTDLALLKAEAKKAILEEKVAYEWWVNFHIRLSIVLTKQSEGQSIVEIFTSERIKEIVSNFPEHILFPTPLGILGFMTFNRAFIEGVYPVGLISRKQKVDRLKMNPKMFLFHDIAHAFKYMVFKHVDKHYLRRKMIDIMETLPLEKRKLTELVYFISIHETENFNWFMQETSLSNQARRKSVVDKLVRSTVDALEKEIISRKMVKDVEQPIDVFMEEVYDKVFLP